MDQYDVASTIEAEATFALGRLAGALGFASSATLRLFGRRVICNTLMAALRQEGHAFTQQRFHAWFAGLLTLTDEPARHARAPRAVVSAILAELSHAAWPPLALAAQSLRLALVAPSDLDEQDHYAAAHDLLMEAQTLVSTCAPVAVGSICDRIDVLHDAIAGSLHFAPSDTVEYYTDRTSRTSLALPRQGSPPRWPVELIAAPLLAVPGFPALPLLSLVRPDTLHSPVAARSIRAMALKDMSDYLFGDLAASAAAVEAIEDLTRHRRGTSRAPEVLAWLRGFGPMRSAQIERLMGASRLGVRAMIAALDEVGAIRRFTIAGSHLFEAIAHPPSVADNVTDSPALSASALAEYEASLEDLDRLLARHGSTDASRA